MLALTVLTACAPVSSPPPAEVPELQTVVLDDTIAIATGQTVYVPVYSYIHMVEQGRTINLTATLSVRNTDRQQSIILSAVDYYNSNGTLVNTSLDNPVELGPLASTEFVIAQEDISGGLGAAFVVEWVAQAEVSAPVIEAVMINTQGNQGISFVSPGRVIDRLP